MTAAGFDACARGSGRRGDRDRLRRAGECRPRHALIFAVAPEARGRLNGVYIAIFFMAGALGSAVGVWAYAYGGWALASRIGLALPLIALARFVFRLTLRRR